MGLMHNENGKYETCCLNQSPSGGAWSTAKTVTRRFTEKRSKPDRWKNKQQSEVTGKNGTPLKFTLALGDAKTD
jgi:hypothetical protein